MPRHRRAADRQFPGQLADGARQFGTGASALASGAEQVASGASGAETGAGQHGTATALSCALLDLDCVIYMGAKDVDRQQPNVYRMELMGATVVPVDSGSGTLKDAVNEALRDWTRARDAERRDLEALRTAIRAGLDSGSGIPAEEVFAELRARYAAKA